ncbi:hypothetical protein [Paracoccus sphaerophysae]|nr:hypothetical protein [Paracoccus sphaerophysae]
MDVARQDGRGKVAEPRMSVTVRPDPELPAVLDLLARAFPGEDLRPLV